MNEGEIKFGYVVAGLGTITASIRKPDDTVRDSQTAVALTDSGHDSLYTNTDAITIQAGDTIMVFIGSAFVVAAEYRPETSAVALRTTISGGIVADTAFVIADGPAFAGAYKNAVCMVTDISAGISIPKRIKSYSAGKLVTLDSDIGFALTVGDVVVIYGNAYEGEISEIALDGIASAVWATLTSDFKTVGTMGRKQGQIEGTLYDG
jgi:hypothetical protein